MDPSIKFSVCERFAEIYELTVDYVLQEFVDIQTDDIHDINSTLDPKNFLFFTIPTQS